LRAHDLRVTSVVNINDVLDGHVSLDIACTDRLYLNAYVPNLQVSGQVIQFCRHLSQPIASPAVIEKIGNRFRREVDAFAKAHAVPVLHLAKPDRTRWDDRKLDHVQPYLGAAERAGRYGMVAIVAAQEFQWVFSTTKKTQGKAVSFDWARTERRVSCYYFYICDREFGPGFIKICTYFPWPAKVWLNGHEWAKRQARRARVPFTELANGFASCERPPRLQAICDRLGPADVQAFFDRWADRLPTPLTGQDRAAGYWWELSMRQVEVSRTMVFDDPRRARGFFEALVADNIGIGRPERVAMVFARQVRTSRAVPGPGLLARHRGPDGFRLQAQPGQAVLKRREGSAHRDRHQQAVGPDRALPPRAPARAGGQGPPGQRPSAYDRACRPGLCHRLCAL
jgi:hypothetical protein